MLFGATGGEEKAKPTAASVVGVMAGLKNSVLTGGSGGGGSSGGGKAGGGGSGGAGGIMAAVAAAAAAAASSTAPTPPPATTNPPPTNKEQKRESSAESARSDRKSSSSQLSGVLPGSGKWVSGGCCPTLPSPTTRAPSAHPHNTPSLTSCHQLIHLK